MPNNRIPIAKLQESLTNFSDIITHLSSLYHQEATGHVMTIMRKLNALLQSVAASNWQLQNISEQYKEATASAEKEALEQQLREQE